MSRNRRDTDETENSGQGLENDVNELYGVAEDDEEEHEDEAQST